MGKILNDDFLDVMACMGFAIGLVNYQKNLEQSDNDDIMKELDDKTNLMIGRLEEDLEKQNELLKEILKKIGE
jgi:hypothetical protein